MFNVFFFCSASFSNSSFSNYADDIQIYISLRPGESHQIEKLMECIVDIKKWMTSNFFLLNSEKNRGVIIGPKTPTSNSRLFVYRFLRYNRCKATSHEIKFLK